MKRFIIEVLTLTMAATAIFSTNVMGEQNKNISNANSLYNLTDDDIEECIVTNVLDWAEFMEPNKKFVIGDIVEVVTSDESVKYTASIFCNMSAYGYATVEINYGEVYVTEGRLLKGEEGVRTAIIDKVYRNGYANKKDKNNFSKKVIQIAPLQYVISKDNSNEIFDNYGNKGIVRDINKSYESTEYTGASKIFIKKINWIDSKYKEIESITLKYYATRWWLPTEAEVERLTGRYACGVQAMLQIAYMTRVMSNNLDSSIKDTYKKLWDYTGTLETSESKKNKSSDKIIYGAGYTEETAKGFIKLAREKGYKDTVFKGVQKNPSVSWIKDKLEYNRPILMGYGINVNGKRSGHFISILGYKRAKKVSTGNVYNYLMVYDGWNAQQAYLNYTTVDMIDCDATYFWVK